MTGFDHRGLSIGIAGPGAVGNALALHLQSAGFRITTVLAKDRSAARVLARRTGAEPAELGDAGTTIECDVLFCCVPDDAIESVARQLAPMRPSWAGVVVAHTSGACEASLLQPIRSAGGAVMSFHPLQTFTREEREGLFDGIYVALEGDPAAVETGRRISEALGCRHVLLDEEAKPLYHLAASTASNALGVLLAMSCELFNTVGIDSDTAIRMLQPLVDRTWSNVQRLQPERALTGPVVRGDVSTVERHIAAIERHAPHLAPAFAALVTEAVRLSVRSGRLHIEPADAILDRIHALLTAADG